MAYGTVGGLAQYAALSGYSISPSPALLERASRVLDALYGPLFIGTAIGFDAQWPRTGIPGIAPNEIPLRVVEAVYELAIMEGQSAGTLSTIMESGKRGPVVKEKAGEVEIAYADPTKAYGYSPAEFGRPTYIDGLLAPFIQNQTSIPVVYVV